MYHKHHTKGIVLWSKNEDSDSKRIKIFSENFGLIDAKAQGARNIHSKLRFGTQDFSFCRFSLVHGKSGWKVAGVRTEKNLFELFKNSPIKIGVMGNILNLVKKLAGEETSHSLFAAISSFFDFLMTARDEEVALAECLVLLRILHSLGYMRHDPDFSLPLLSSKIETEHLNLIAPRRRRLINLINESLKAARI